MAGIKRCRKEKGLTQGQLGAMVDLSATAIMRYEQNTRQPKIQILAEIAKALDVSVAYLLCVSDIKQPTPSDELATFAIINSEAIAASNDEKKDMLSKYDAEHGDIIKKATQEHLEALNDICTERLFSTPDRYESQLPYMEERIRIVTNFLRNNYHMLQSCMPGMHLDATTNNQTPAPGKTEDGSENE